MTSQNNTEQHLQQQQQQLSFNEDCLAAQRAAHESILIGRETAAVIQQQGEQLHRADTMADQTLYQLDRATRLLKGMTWSGWVNNMFSAVPSVPGFDNNNSNASIGGKITSEKTTQEQHQLPIAQLPLLEKYDTLPNIYNSDIVQALKTYHATVLSILQYCETTEQQRTCQQICNDMYTNIHTKLAQQQQGNTNTVEAKYSMEMKNDLEQIRQYQIRLQQQQNTNSHPLAKQQTEDHDREDLFGGRNSSRIRSTSNSVQKSSPQHSSNGVSSSSSSVELQHQEEHLNFIASSLNELGTIAQSLNQGLVEQGDTINSIENKSDFLHETSKMVTRRTNRLIQQKSWGITTSPLNKSVLFGTVMIRHVDSGKYLSVMNNDLYLVNRYNRISCTFDVYQRQGGSGNIVGFKSHTNHKWIGQSFLTGSITCSATTFSKREELETDNSSTWSTIMTSTSANTTNKKSDTSATSTDTTTNPSVPLPTTRLLCVSAGWGQGGYIHVNTTDKNYAIEISGISLENSQHAAMWSIVPIRN